MITWEPINTAPVGPTIMLANAKTGVVAVGYGEWFKAPMPRWIALEPEGVGRFKATHWAAMPEAPKEAASDA
jgi:hypothetical protein